MAVRCGTRRRSTRRMRSWTRRRTTAFQQAIHRGGHHCTLAQHAWVTRRNRSTARGESRQQRAARQMSAIRLEGVAMLIYRAPRAVRVHTALAQSRRRMASYRISIALASAAITLGACTYSSSPPSNPIIGFQPQSITLTTVPGGTAKGAVSVVNVVGTELAGLTTSVGPYTGNGANWLTVDLAGVMHPHRSISRPTRSTSPRGATPRR